MSIRFSTYLAAGCCSGGFDALITHLIPTHQVEPCSPAPTPGPMAATSIGGAVKPDQLYLAAPCNPGSGAADFAVSIVPCHPRR